MYLQKLEMQGFKSFASRTILEFLGPRAKTKGITAIVGPNGSGKSNVADGIRWVLGEQSMKLLRGKKSEDVIFSGSEKKARSGFAEVTLHLNNEDRKVDIEYPEIAITRRLYRDGESEYLINNAKVRLSDIQLLLARANFGERHYSVIGQGMIDAILQLSPEERKDFFDEATGVKPLQIKKEQSLGKLRLTEENLARATELLREIEPRMRSLSRQVKRLEEREAVEQELQGLQHAYYLSALREITDKLTATKKILERENSAKEKKLSEVNSIRQEFSGLEEELSPSETVLAYQKKTQELLREKGRLHSRLLELDTVAARERVVAAGAAPLPLTKIIAEIRGLQIESQKIAERLLAVKTISEARALAAELEKLSQRSRELAEKLEQPPSEKLTMTVNRERERERAEIEKAMEKINQELAALEWTIKDSGKEEKKKTSAVFEAQRRLEAKLGELRALESRENEVKIELARLETRRDSLEQEMAQELRERLERVRQEAAAGGEAAAIDPVAAQPRIQKLKYQLELIGGIDPEVVKEHKETSERFSFLSTQTEDLRQSIEDLEKIIIELNRGIEEQFSRAFSRLSDDFGRYFKILFNGGAARLERRRVEPEHTDEEKALEEGLSEEKPKTVADKFKSEDYTIEIFANPPGKKIKSVTMLSGGERALTAIALVSSIIANNPSPFVVLDEVDAALDESNSIRFAEIIDELSARSQFIVITHNRYTMEKSTILYGVTMREDGTSQLLSVSLEEARNKK